jgi:hypothetical protein
LIHIDREGRSKFRTDPHISRFLPVPKFTLAEFAPAWPFISQQKTRPSRRVLCDFIAALAPSGSGKRDDDDATSSGDGGAAPVTYLPSPAQPPTKTHPAGFFSYRSSPVGELA